MTALTFRNIAHLGKIVASLDVLSGGRVDCGIGLGWFEDEHLAYGLRVAERRRPIRAAGGRTAIAATDVGSGVEAVRRGNVLSVPDTTCYPRPLQERVPIVVGGSGERRTLRLAAQYADGCNMFGDPATVARKVQVLRRHCDDVGRDRAEVSVSHLSTVLVGDDTAQVRSLVELTRPQRVSAERHARTVNAAPSNNTPTASVGTSTLASTTSSSAWPT